jgi:hypothetical protein
MVSESGNAVGKSWPKESGSPRSRFRGTAKRGLPNRTADAVAAVPKAPVMNTIRLCGNDIDGDAISCTGPQLATLFETIVQTDSLLDRVWYAADVDPAPGQLASYGGNAVRIIGGIDRLVDLIRDRPQVDFGIFCVDPCFVQFETPQRTRLGRGTIPQAVKRFSDRGCGVRLDLDRGHHGSWSSATPSASPYSSAEGRLA